MKIEAVNDLVVRVDARGLLCPEPVVLARKALDQALPGALIEIWATDPLAPLDIETLCARRGNQYLGTATAPDGHLTIHVRRSGLT